jgi:hypothetical protein
VNERPDIEGVIGRGDVGCCGWTGIGISEERMRKQDGILAFDTV